MNEVSAEQDYRRPCDECGGLVDLSALITVAIKEEDGSRVETQMTEWEARDLLTEMGIPQPPVMCDKHERYAISTEAVRA